jgi:2-polyprenyl-3-methyl-5-hydroxy-6-metoxy-1,4-benzoquinol methylase
MPKAEWEENTIESVLNEAGLWRFKTGDIVSILDVACGLSFKSKFIDAQIRVGVDIHDKYFEHIESSVPYAVIKYDVRKLEEIFVPNSFDVVIALDIIEHLEKDESLKMIEACEKIARKAVILETPEGFIPQDMDIQGHGADEWQTHRCGWEVKELESMGYQVTVRDYLMADVKRHTTEERIDPNVKVMDAIKYLKK